MFKRLFRNGPQVRREYVMQTEVRLADNRPLNAGMLGVLLLDWLGVHLV
jgi:hypothetical protein